jgi:hypothetical protein
MSWRGLLLAVLLTGAFSGPGYAENSGAEQ